jgi:hypothetical protein
MCVLPSVPQYLLYNEPKFMVRRRLVQRPVPGMVVDCKYGDVIVTAVHDGGRSITVKTERHGTERIGRAESGWWTVVRRRAWAAWNQGLFRSVRKAVIEANEWFAECPNNYENTTLWIIPDDSGWRLVNGRTPEAAHTFYGPIRKTNVGGYVDRHV